MIAAAEFRTLQPAIARARDAYKTAFERSQPSDVAGREALYHQLKALEAVEVALIVQVNAEQIAEHVAEAPTSA